MRRLQPTTLLQIDAQLISRVVHFVVQQRVLLPCWDHPQRSTGARNWMYSSPPQTFHFNLLLSPEKTTELLKAKNKELKICIVLQCNPVQSSEFHVLHQLLPNTTDHHYGLRWRRRKRRKFINQVNTSVTDCTIIAVMAGCQWGKSLINAGRPKIIFWTSKLMNAILLRDYLIKTYTDAYWCLSFFYIV